MELSAETVCHVCSIYKARRTWWNKTEI